MLQQLESLERLEICIYQAIQSNFSKVYHLTKKIRENKTRVE
jgi:hypothetical protein